MVIKPEITTQRDKLYCYFRPSGQIAPFIFSVRMHCLFQFYVSFIFLHLTLKIGETEPWHRGMRRKLNNKILAWVYSFGYKAFRKQSLDKNGQE